MLLGHHRGQPSECVFGPSVGSLPAAHFCLDSQEVRLRAATPRSLVQFQFGTCVLTVKVTLCYNRDGSVNATREPLAVGIDSAYLRHSLR